MFDLGSWGEFFIIVVAALVLIGPKELPTVLRALGRWVQKFRRISFAFRQTLDQFIQEGEFEEFQKNQNASVLKAGKDQKGPKKGKQKRPEKRATKKPVIKKKIKNRTSDG